MDEREQLLAELQGSREHAAALIRAKLEAVASQIQELAARIAGDVQTVLPPDLEVLLPLGPIGERLAAAAKPASAAPPSRTLGLEPLRSLDAGRAQSAVLQELLRQLEGWCGARAILVFRDGQASGWAGEGFGAGDPSRGWRAAIADSEALGKVSSGQPVVVSAGSDAAIRSWLPNTNVRTLLVPMTLRGKIVGALLAAEGAEGLDTPVVQQLTYVAGLMLETLSIRTTPVAALLDPIDLTAEVVAPAIPAAAVPPSEAVEAGEEPVPIEAHTVPPGELVPAVAGAETVHLPIPVVSRPVPSRLTPEEEKKHEEARRFARLLVSEIRLYNEQVVQDGKQNRDIYARLKEDIDRSREMYEQRVSAEVRAQGNYFYDELVRILADGDGDALGL